MDALWSVTSFQTSIYFPVMQALTGWLEDIKLDDPAPIFFRLYF